MEQVSYSINGNIVILVNSGVKLRLGDATYDIARLILSKDELAGC